jgi:4,5:9,10-diseco-3-hydroxy-5,9,17-trioxoandrosta-1(10),2-diene-4-oate hydrolase
LGAFDVFQSNWVVVPQVRSLYETVYGVRTHYVTAGEGEPLILVHGGGPGASGATGWSQTIPALAKHFRVYAIDLIGNGDTDIPLVEFSMQTLVEHVAGFIDTLKLQNVRIMGNSQGAYVAMKYVLDNPGRVKSAAIISTGNLASACGFEAKGKAEPLPRFDGSRESLEAFLKLIVNDPTKLTKELMDARYAIASRPGHTEMFQSIARFRKLCQENSSIRQAWFVRDRMKELKIPYCILWGEKDRTAPLDPQGLGLKELLPHIPFHVIAGSGHQVQNDKPEECNRILVDHFLSTK